MCTILKYLVYHNTRWRSFNGRYQSLSKLLNVIVKPDNYKMKFIPCAAEYIAALRERMYELILEILRGHQEQLLLFPCITYYSGYTQELICAWTQLHGHRYRETERCSFLLFLCNCSMHGHTGTDIDTDKMTRCSSYF